MPAMPTQPSPLRNSMPQRWNSSKHLANWLQGFRSYFPRKAHLAEKVAARLAGFDDIGQLLKSIPPSSKPDASIERMDQFYAQRRMVWFMEDRLILTKEFRILPDAADLFLTSCPVGCGRCVLESNRIGLDAALSYYPDDQEPSSRIREVIEQQYQEALGQLISQVDYTQRLGDYLHPKLLINLFHFLRWDVELDAEGSGELDPSIPAVRVGLANDPDLGRVEIFSMRFTALPNWFRDEVFWTVLRELKTTRDLRNRPVVVLNNRPIQLIRAGHTYTSIGWMITDSMVMPLMVSQHGHSVGSLLVELVTFNPETSTAVADDGNVALSVIWTLLRETATQELPPRPRFRSMPDHWMIPVPL